MFAISLTLLACTGIPVNDVRDTNDTWWKMYNQDRRPTVAEDAQYNALTPEEKTAWEANGKPVPGCLTDELLKAAEDYHNAVRIECDLAEGTSGDAEEHPEAPSE